MERVLRDLVGFFCEVLGLQLLFFYHLFLELLDLSLRHNVDVLLELFQFGVDAVDLALHLFHLFSYFLTVFCLLIELQLDLRYLIRTGAFLFLYDQQFLFSNRNFLLQFDNQRVLLLLHNIFIPSKSRQQFRQRSLQIFLTIPSNILLFIFDSIRENLLFLV